LTGLALGHLVQSVEYDQHRNRSSRSSTVDVATLSEAVRAVRRTARNFLHRATLARFGVVFVLVSLVERMGAV